MEKSKTYSSPPLNYLIYGHPGTGKRTYASQLAVSLADQVPCSEVAAWPPPQLYDRYNALVNEGQICLLVMHPGWTYADLIERCLFLSDNVVVHDGVLKQMATEARGNLIEHLLQQKPEIVPDVDFKELYTGFLHHLQKTGEQIPAVGNQDPFFLHSIQKNGDILLRKPKTFQLIRIKRSKIRQLFLIQQNEVDPQVVTTRWQAILTGENASAFEAVWSQFAQFQHVFAAASTVPEATGDDPYQDIQMDILPQGVLQAAKKYILIMEHMDTIDPQQIFGDVLPMLDSRRREGCRCAQTALLPGSKTGFALPPNLFLIGTASSIPNWTEGKAFLMSKVFRFIHLDAQNRPQEWPRIRSLSTQALWQSINRVILEHRGAALQFPGGAFQDCHSLEHIRDLFSNRILPYFEWLAHEDGSLHDLMLKDLLGPLVSSQDKLREWKLADFVAIANSHT